MAHNNSKEAEMNFFRFFAVVLAIIMNFMALFSCISFLCKILIQRYVLLTDRTTVCAKSYFCTFCANALHVCTFALFVLPE